MASSSRRIRSWVRTKWEGILMILLVIVLVPQFYQVFKFKHKRHHNGSQNSPVHSNPLHEKLAQLKVDVPQVIDDKVETTKTTTATTVLPHEVDPIKLSQQQQEPEQQPVVAAAAAVNSPVLDVPERDRGHLDTSDLTFDNAPSVPEQPQLAQADYGSEKELSSKDLRKAGVSWDNVDIESDQELLQFTRGRDIFTLPNPGFVYHNKLPKSGGTTMHAMLGVLAKWNQFRYLKLEPSLVKFFDGEKMSKLINTLQERKKVEKPFFIFKHHYFFNASSYGLETPTWINVIRDPLTWFESNFYFKRFGWERQPGSRRREDQDLTIDECVKTNHEDCKRVKWKYNQFLCGNSPVCTGHSDADKKKASEIAKMNIAKNFFIVGILEQFVDTLHLLEKLMPKYYDRAVEALNSETVQHTINMTKTQHKTPMNDESRAYFRTGPLKYEADVYEFAKKVFNEYVDRVGIERYVKPSK